MADKAWHGVLQGDHVGKLEAIFCKLVCIGYFQIRAFYDKTTLL